MNYEIKGTPLPVVECFLNPGESLITEAGAMSWMSGGMQMETIGNSVGKALGRLVSRESMFLNKYTATQNNDFIALASSFPGDIIPVQLSMGNDIIVQKSAFLASEESIQLSVAYKKKISSSLFGGEGFIMQRLSGNGIAFLEVDGSVCCYTLQPSEIMYIDTGHLAMMDASVTMDIEMISGAKNIFFGGEGLFNTKVMGPGRVWLQSMPISSLARVVRPYISVRD